MEVANNVDFFAEAIVGVGYYTSAADRPLGRRAKAAVDRFAEDVNLDGLLLQGAREIIAFGNSFWEKVEPEHLDRLKILPIGSIQSIQRTPQGEVRLIVQRLGATRVEFEPGELIHWRWNAVDAEAFGRGIMHDLMEQRRYTVKFDGATKKYTVPTLLDLKAQMDDDIRRVLHHYMPRSVYVSEDASDKEIGALASVLGKMDAGERAAWNKKLEVVQEAMDPRARYDAFIGHVNNMILHALRNPVLRLFITPGYTEASAKIAEAQLERKITAYQRFFKRVVEREIFWPIVRQEGTDPLKADVRLHWGVETPEVTLTDLIDIIQAQAKAGETYLTAEEMRNMLEKFGVELIKEEKTEGEEME
ncbi:MAG: hypothetical protein ACE5IB_05175 [Candidatus Geothermarchaeales archaeon]